MPTDRQAALASTTTKTDNNPHPQAQEGNRSAPPPQKHTKFHSHPGARETFHLLPLPERAGPDGPLSFNHLPPTPKETRSFSLKPLNRRSLAPGTTGIQHPPRSPLRGRGRKPHAGSVSRAPHPPQDLAPRQPVPVLRPQQARSCRVHMASGVHMAINGPPSLPRQGALRLPDSQRHSRPKPRLRPPASPPPPRRSESRGMPGAARGPGVGGADAADPWAPPAHTRRVCTRGRDKQVPSPDTLRLGLVPKPCRTPKPDPSAP